MDSSDVYGKLRKLSGPNFLGLFFLILVRTVSVCSRLKAPPNNNNGIIGGTSHFIQHLLDVIAPLVVSRQC
ncbi:hypothetical protein F2P81_017270 [Scophthalmus maximus]|uniref:Uncharacterized protein n=1 Tax=Scophthalmus maximus TaxID=52904 RepID=A0A6A4SD59_SCOMX|nr:hypothetical protein F2P81_017270 [Scophthalmus maximus]